MMAVNDIDRDKQQIVEAVDLLKTLSHPLRLAILCDLLERGEMSAGDIVEAQSSRYSQSQVSQYLGILREIGYVETRRDGQTIWYRLKSHEVKAVIETLHSLYCR